MAIQPGMFKRMHRERKTYRKLTDEGVREIRRLRGDGLTLRAIREQFEKASGARLGLTTISYVLSGQTHSSVQ